MLLIIFLAGVLLLVLGLSWLAAEHRGTEARWPLFARPVLSERERALFRQLQVLHPEHIVLAQFALSQLIDVTPGSPNRRAVRNRFSQLVADFVLCRRDFSVVAVIELDDASHLGADRRGADARKTKAVASAGLRLVRIPGGPLPSDAELRMLLGEESGGVVGGASSISSRARGGAGRCGLDAETAAVLRPMVILAVVGIVMVIGGAVYWQLTERVTPKAIALPAASLGVGAAAASSARVSAPPGVATTVMAQAEQQRAEAHRRLMAQGAADELARQKEQEWQRYYVAPATCESPEAWTDQVECGNRYMRARREFDARWQARNGAPRAK